MTMNELLYRVMAPAGDDGEVAGGGASVDRGDSIEPAAQPEAAKTDENPMDTGEKVPEKVEDAAEPPRNDKGQFIPKHRFDQVVGRSKEQQAAMAARINELEQQLNNLNNIDLEKFEAEISDLEAKRDAALLDGNKDAAAALSKEIRLRERQVAISEAGNMGARAKEEAREEIRFDLTVERLETQYPVLNPSAEEYSQELVDEVLWDMEAFKKNGLTPSQALERAVRNAMRGREDAKPSEARGLAAAKGDDRGTRQVQKNIDAANRQPASTKDVGLDTDKLGTKGDLPDITKLTYEEFNALPDSVRARLRGDEA